MVTTADYYEMRRKYFKLIKVNSDKYYQRYLDMHYAYWVSVHGN